MVGWIFYSRLVMYVVVMVVFGYLGFTVLALGRWLVILILGVQLLTILALIWVRFRRR